jgi:hypothetical protein
MASLDENDIIYEYEYLTIASYTWTFLCAVIGT